MTIGRPYHEERDLAAVTRMWREVGWIDDTDEQAEAMRRFMQRGTALVADIAGEAECMVHRTPGSMRYQAADLPLCAISGVTTSHVGDQRRAGSQEPGEPVGLLVGAVDPADLAPHPGDRGQVALLVVRATHHAAESAPSGGSGARR